MGTQISASVNARSLLQIAGADAHAHARQIALHAKARTRVRRKIFVRPPRRFRCVTIFFGDREFFSTIAVDKYVQSLYKGGVSELNVTTFAVLLIF